MKGKSEIIKSQKIRQRKDEGNKQINSDLENTTQSEKMRYKNADKIYE